MIMKKIIELIQNKINRLENEAEEQIQELNNQDICDMCLHSADVLKEIIEEIKFLLDKDCEFCAYETIQEIKVKVFECDECKIKNQDETIAYGFSEKYKTKNGFL